MKKILYMLMMFIVASSHLAAQQEAATVTSWDGTSKRLRMRADSLITFSYTAEENGTLYIYANDQDVSDNVHVSIWGGWYHDGAYDADAPLQEAGSYENGVGIYGWIKVFAGDEVRFTLSTPAETEGVMAIFTLKSVFFGESIKGDSWEQPIELTQNTKTSLPVYKNYDVDYLKELSYATFCRFVAPSSGVASILTDQYLVYYIEEGLYGSTEKTLNYVSQDMATDDHEFVVEKDSAYIVIVPNARPADVTFKMTASPRQCDCLSGDIGSGEGQQLLPTQPEQHWRQVHYGVEYGRGMERQHHLHEQLRLRIGRTAAGGHQGGGHESDAESGPIVCG